jgi:GNAT superfamily N-acetyltransferase
MDKQLPARQDILIRPLEEQCLEAVVSIHRSVLGDTLNSHLGAKHLALLYRTMLQDPNCFVAVALYNDLPIGFVSGTLNMDATKSLFFRSASLAHWAKISLRLISHPGLLLDFWHGIEIGRPIFWQNALVEPILTTIGVEERFQALGIGKDLVNALEEFFLVHRVSAYRLDTLESNQKARNFYSRIGFLQVDMRAGSVILIKPLSESL